MKLLLIGDFHGKIPRLKDKDFDAVLCTGDLPRSKDTTRINFKYWKELHEGAQMHDLISKEKYLKIYKNVESTQRKILTWLNRLNKPVFLVSGNHDLEPGYARSIKYFKAESLNRMIKNYKNIKLVINNQVRLEGVQVLCFSGSYSSHFKTKKFFRTWNNRLNKLFKLRDRKSFVIFLTHDPPRGVLDKINNKKSPVHGKHVGDTEIAKFVKKYAPKVMVCGHMHENQGKKRLGKTLVVNPGYAHDNHYALMDVKGKDFKVKLV